jgi:hypothetical protein
MVGLCMGGEALSLRDSKPEAHIFTEPPNVVGPPSIVEEAEVKAFREVGLVSRKIHRQPLAESDYRRIQRLDFKGAFGAFVA